MTDDRRLLLRETAISVAINTALSAAFFVVVFGTRHPVQLAAYGTDFPMQAFMIALMGSLVPSLLLRRRMGGAAGRVLPRRRALGP